MAALLASVPLAGHAEAYGPPDPLLGFVIGAIVGVPAAIACVLVEVILPRRSVRQAVTLAAAVAAIVAAVMVHAATRPAFAALAPLALPLWMVLPALVLLTLRGTVAKPWLRLGAGWLLGLALLVLLRSGATKDVGLNFFIGGAAACLVLWSIAVLILGIAGVRAPAAESGSTTLHAGPELRAAAGRLKAAALREAREAAEFLGPAKAGLLWWLVPASAIYLGAGAALAAGLLDITWIQASIGVPLAYFGKGVLFLSTPLRNWWLYGMPWSLLAGAAVWGLAGLFGAFDPGRLRWLRLAGLVFGGVLIAWSASIFMSLLEVRAEEEAIVSGRR